MDFQKVIEKRASVRRFSTKKPPIEKVIELLEASNLAPSSGNMAIVKYIIVEKPDSIQKIAQACQQEFISQSPFVVVICSDSKNVDRAYDKRAATYIKHHVGAVVENFLLKATNEGLASCWIGAFSEETIRNLLKIPDDINLEVILPVGYRPAFDKTIQRPKRSVYERVYFETWKNKMKYPYKKIGEH